MNKLQKIQLNAYYKEISSFAGLTGKQKKEFLNELKTTVNEYMELNPDCTIDDIKSVFGTPEEISLSFIENGNLTKVKRQINIKKVIIAAVITALLIWFAFAVISLIDVHLEADGTLTEGMLIISDITEGNL